MTDQEINIAIAEACKWRCEDTPFERHGTILKGGLAWWHPEIAGARFLPPDYLNDLNAIHQACMAHLTGRQGMEFFWVLLRVMNQPENLAMSNAAQIAIHATARQRSEAFLRTIGKWRDG